MARTRIAVALLGMALAHHAAAGEQGGAEGGKRAFRTPPQEAQAACAKLELGATCHFTFDGRAHDGTCRRGPEGEGPIACAPLRGGGRDQKEKAGSGRADAPGGG